MNDSSDQQSSALIEGGPDEVERMRSLRQIATLVYVLQAMSFFVGFTAVIGVILNHLRLAEVEGTWLESHFIWQIRTFWLGLLGGVIGVLTSLLLVGLLILVGVWIWGIYRVLKGWLNLADGRPMYSEEP